MVDATNKSNGGNSAAKRQPHWRETEAIERATGIIRQRPERPAVQFKSADGNTVVARHDNENGAAIHRMIDAFGTCSEYADAFFSGQLEFVTRQRGEERGDNDCALNAGLAIVASVEPKSEIETCLAIQMAGTHTLAAEMLGRARRTDDLERLERYVALANKLQRTFAIQMEALSKIRNGGKQTVEVKYVDARNSQNIIADQVVTGGGKSGNAGEPHATASVAGLPFAPSVPMWGKNPEGDAMPGASDPGEQAVPNARRQQPGSTEGLSPSSLHVGAPHHRSGRQPSRGRGPVAGRAKSAVGDQG